MTINTASELELQQLINAVADLERVAKEADPDGARRNSMVRLPGESYLSFMHRVFEERNQQFRQAIERFRMMAELLHGQIALMTQHVLHRAQGRSSSTGKTSAKKSASSSGSSGGDGDGDGPTPHRTRSKQKSRPSNSSHKSQRRSRVSPSATAHTSSPQVPPRRPFPGRDIAVILVILCLFGIALAVQGVLLQVLVILCLFVIALVALGHPEVAKDVWRSVPALLKQLAGTPTEDS